MELAAEKGGAVSQYNLGCFYRRGHGVAANQQEAVRWLRKAAAQGYKYATDELKEMGY